MIAFLTLSEYHDTDARIKVADFSIEAVAGLLGGNAILLMLEFNPFSSSNFLSRLVLQVISFPSVS